jgi:CRISPR system Cascade subunit CasA
MTHVGSFDLRRQPWLPVRTVQGAAQEVSLVEAFDRADQLRAVTGEVPSQVLALYRLLLAVLLRAVDWDRGDPIGHWQRAWRGQVDLAAHVRRYLDRYADRFDLLHPSSPFLQVAGLRTAKGEFSPLTSLIADVPNNAQYFTTRAGRSLQAIGYAEAARWLVHAQAFDASGIKSGALGDVRVKGGKGYPIGVGWAGQLGGVLIEGATLRETLLLNLVLLDTDEHPWPADDHPVWERPPLGPGVEDDGRVPQGLADQLTWPSRRILLHVDGPVVVGVLIANGDPLTAHNRFRTETMTGWRRSIPQEKRLKSATPIYLPRTHQPERAWWRGLEALWAQVGVPDRQRDPDLGRPPGVLNWIYQLLSARALPEDFPIRSRAIGIEYGSNNSVIDEIIDDSLLLHAVLLGEHGRVLRAAAVDAVAAADHAVQAAANLAGNLAVAAGGEAPGPRDRARERGFFALDSPFRDWLGSLNTGDDPIQKRASWERTVRREITELGRELIDGAGIPAWIGRDQHGRRVDSALAAIWFDAALAKALPVTATATAPVPTGAQP